MVYNGQEKIKLIAGEYVGVYGYVRRAHVDGRLLLILDNGYKISCTEDDVEYIAPNYFLVGIEEFKRNLENI